MSFKKLFGVFQKPKTRDELDISKLSSFLLKPERLPAPPLELLSYGAGLDPIATANSSKLLTSPLNCADFKNNSLLEATLIGTEIAHRVLGLTVTDLKIKFPNNYELGSLIYLRQNRDPTASSRENVEKVGKATPGFWDPSSSTMYINCQENKTPREAAATAIHETFHKHTGFEVGNAAPADDVLLAEGATEYATQQILQSICKGQQYDQERTAYGQVTCFFEALGQILGPAEVVQNILNGDFTKIVDAYDSKCKKSGVEYFSLETLVRLPGSESGEAWDPISATQALLGVKEKLEQKGLLPKVQDFRLENIKPLGNTNTELQARALVDITTVMNEMIPATISYISPQLGVLTYVRADCVSGGAKTYVFDDPVLGKVTVEPVMPWRFGRGWTGAGSYTEFPNLTLNYNPSSKSSNLDLEKTEKERPQRTSVLRTTNLAAFEQKLIDGKLKLRPIEDVEFDSIKTFEDLFLHLRQIYPPATDYYLGLMIKTVNSILRLEQAPGFPPSPSEIAKRVYLEAQKYQDEYLVLGSVYDITEDLLARFLNTINQNRIALLKDKVLGPFSQLIQLPAGISELAYSPKHEVHSQLLKAMVKSVQSSFGVSETQLNLLREELFYGSFLILKQLHEPIPTNNELVSATAMLLSEINGKAASKASFSEAIKTVILKLKEEVDAGTRVFDGTDGQIALAFPHPSQDQLLQNAGLFLAELKIRDSEFDLDGRLKY
jgi:hypothetical protein